jgi:hypothetical protein
MIENPYEPPKVESPYEARPAPPASNRPMKARDAYGVVVRGFGLLQLSTALWYFATLPAYALGQEDAAGDRFYNLAYAAMGAVFGILLIGFARPIVRLSYPLGSEEGD